MVEILDKLHALYLDKVWRVDIHSLGLPHRGLITVLRLTHNLALDMLDGRLTLRAMSLVYTTLLSLVPLLAVSFSLLKAFGVHNQIEPLLIHFLEPLGDKGIEFSHRIIGFVQNMKVGVLGSLGMAMLIYTVVSLVQKIEEAFNFIWHIRQPRRLVRRFSDYMSVILVGPVLVFAALGITAAVMGTSLIQDLAAMEPFTTLLDFASRLVPYLLVCAAFTFVYIFMPNTKVHFSSALIGGLVAGVLWESCGWGFAAFIASSTKYTAIYSGFAILIMFMIWLYVSWLILLLGAQVSYYYQHPTLLTWRRQEWTLGNEAREQAGILAMLLIGYTYYYQQQWWSLEALARRMKIPSLSLEPILSILVKSGFVTESGDDPPAYFPARDIETIKLVDVIAAVRHAEASPLAESEELPEMLQVGAVMRRVDGAICTALEQETIKDLVLAQEAPKGG